MDVVLSVFYIRKKQICLGTSIKSVFHMPSIDRDMDILLLNRIPTFCKQLLFF